MAYLSLYRKWRPQTFDDVVGQEHVVRTLKNALDSGRNSHAYIFAGPRGTGKTTLARLLAKGLNCENGPTGSPCNACDQCARIARGSSVDVIEIDGASNRGIDEIRDVREKVKFAPAQGRFKVYIIDEVHMLTTEAFNALLKVLEEPPGHVVFVFATTEPHKIPATIVSRCQKFDFRAFTPDEIISQTGRVAEAEGAQVEAGALSLIARHSAGGMRDALGYLDQCIAFADGEEVTESLAAQVLGVVEREQLEALADHLSAGDVGKCLLLIKEIADSGRDLRQFAADAVQYFRDLMLLRAAPDSRGLVILTDREREAAALQAKRFEVGRLLQIVETLGRAEADMRWAQTAQLPLEMAVIEVVETRSVSGEDGAESDLVRRLERLEAQVAKLAADGGEARSQSTVASFPKEGGARSAPPGQGLPKAPSSNPVPQAGERARSVSSVSEGPENTASDSGGSKGGEAAAPPPAPPKPRPTGGDADLLEKVRQVWPQLLESLRAAKHVQQEAFLREGVPGAVEGQTVIVYFSPNHRFHQANISQEKNKNVVETALKKLLGREVEVDAVLGEPPTEPRPEVEQSETGAAGKERDSGDGDSVDATRGDANVDPKEIDEPILRAALKLFGGTITKLERKEVEP